MRLSNKLIVIFSTGVGIEVFCAVLILAFYIILGLFSILTIRTLAEIGVCLFLPTLVAFFVIYKMLNKQILNPINQLKDATKTIASGNLGQKMEVVSSDELGELAGYINMIIKNLAGALQGMSNSLRDMKNKEDEMSESLSKLEEARKVTLQAVKDLSLERIKLIENKAKEEALLASIEDGIIATDVMGQINYINLEALKLLGFNAETDILNKKFSDAIKVKDSADGPIHSTQDQIIIGKTLTGNKITGYFYFLNSSGDGFPVSIVASPIITNNSITGAIIIFRDISINHNLSLGVNKGFAMESHIN